MPRDLDNETREPRSVRFLRTKGCGRPVSHPSAIDGPLPVTSDALVIADQDGRFVREIKSDGEGRALQNPNDIVSDGTGVYLSDSGTFNPKAASGPFTTGGLGTIWHTS